MGGLANSCQLEVVQVVVVDQHTASTHAKPASILDHGHTEAKRIHRHPPKEDNLGTIEDTLYCFHHEVSDILGANEAVLHEASLEILSSSPLPANRHEGGSKCGEAAASLAETYAEVQLGL